MREQERGERQHQRAEPESDRRGGAVAGLEALAHPGHEQEQRQAGQHRSPERERPDHLVGAAQGLGVTPALGPGEHAPRAIWGPWTTSSAPYAGIVTNARPGARLEYQWPR